jgi:tetratricopeptide (TPR) repeat protein
LQSELEAVIRADTQQPAEVRALAGELARTLDDDPRDLNELAWRISAKPCTSDDAQRAVRCARRALELAPEDPDVLNTLGVALYRAGRFDECLATLRRSDELGRARRDSRQAADVAFLAMAHWKLGHAEEARAELAALVALASTGGNDETDAFVAEVRALIQPR